MADSVTVLNRYDVSAVPLQGGYVAKQCPVRCQLDMLHPAEPVPEDAFTKRLFDRGNTFEARIVADICDANPDAVVIAGGGEEAEAATLEAMRTGAPVIFNGRLRDEAGRRVGKPDLLLRAASGGYRPADVKWHGVLEPATGSGKQLPALCSTLAALAFESAVADEEWAAKRKPEDALQLAHYVRMLEALGMACGDRMAGIIGTEGRVVWYDLDAAIWRTPSVSEGTKLRSTMERYDFEFAFRLDIIAVAQQHQLDPTRQLLVVPVRCGECPSCPWRGWCIPLLQTPPGDVSLIPRVGWPQWKAYQDAGITDRAKLAALDAGALPEALAVMKPAVVQEHIDQARAALGPHGAYRRRGVDGITVPRADVEVDIDMENTELGCYLWGCLVTERGGDAQPEYRAFVTWDEMTPAVEAALGLEFWRWLLGLRDAAHRQGRTFAAYCWNASAENQYLRRLAIANEIEDEVGEFIASGDWVDLMRVWDTQLLTGGSSSLKEIAPLCGASWDVDDPGGGESMVKYDLAVAGDETARAWLLRYNEGDVRATAAVREWLTVHGPSVPGI